MRWDTLGGSLVASTSFIDVVVAVQRVLSSAAIMARLIVALACAAGVSAFLAPSAPTQPAKTVVFGKGGELRDRKQQRPHASARAAAARPRCSERSAHQLWCKKTAGKRRTLGSATSDAKKRPRREEPRGERGALRRGEPRTETSRRQKYKSRARGITPRFTESPRHPKGLARRDGRARDAAQTNNSETPHAPTAHPLHSRTGIATVGNTQKITEAMRLVAAAKVRRAQEAVLQTRPFSETLQSVFLGLIDQLGKEPIDIPLLETREVKKVTLLAMSGDRGLCGSYNTRIIKKTEARKEELEAQGIEVEIVPVGTKVAGYFRRRGVEFPSEYNCPQVPTAEFAAAVSSEMLNKFLDGETDKVELIYTQFVSLIASAPKLKTLLPLSKTGLEAAEDEMFELTTEDGELAVETTPLDAPEAKEFPKDTIFEQDPIAILNGILPLYLDGQILRSLQEAVASELASRMQSMQSASDNAKDLKKSLSQTYNRIRQAGVTQEILEIVAGASASE